MGYKLVDKCPGGIFSIPHFLYDNGQYAGLSPAAQRLLCLLYRILNRCSTPWFCVSAAVLKQELGSDAKTIREARRELEQAGLVKCSSAASPGAPIEFHLLNPCSKEPFPLEGCNAVKTYDPRRRKQALASQPVTLASAGLTVGASLEREADPHEAAPITLTVRVAPIRPVPKSVLSRSSVCRIHSDCPSTWRRADGSQVCDKCHPNPNPSSPILSSKVCISPRLDWGGESRPQ